MRLLCGRRAALLSDNQTDKKTWPLREKKTLERKRGAWTLQGARCLLSILLVLCWLASLINSVKNAFPYRWPPGEHSVQSGTSTLVALCPPVTASGCWAAVIVPRWHESSQEIPPTKRPPGWNVGTALVLEPLRLGWNSRAMWCSEECRRPTSGRKGEMEGQVLEDSGGERARLAEDFERGFGAGSRDCSVNPQLAGQREVWGCLCWGGHPSLWSALGLFCQTYLRSEG